MFHKTSLRLTGLYLTILMVISVFFSSALYTVATRELDRGSQRQEEIINRLPPPNSAYLNYQRRFLESRETAVLEAKDRILGQLILTNILVFIVGGGLSYLLARKTLEPIEEAHTSLERFTADASHELRTPIAAMKSEIEVALLQPRLSTKDTKELLQSNLEELDRLTGLTDGLLAIARREQRQLELKEQAIAPIVNSAVKKLKPLSNKKNISIEIEADKKIKAAVDKHGLEEALVILIDNAVKYSKDDSLVEIKLQSENSNTIIAIKDYGTGIKAKDLPYIFDRFYRADTSRSQTIKGHGLGLSIAKQLIESQNGTIKITSKPSKSTTATVTIPANA